MGTAGCVRGGRRMLMEQIIGADGTIRTKLDIAIQR